MLSNTSVNVIGVWKKTHHRPTTLEAFLLEIFFSIREALRDDCVCFYVSCDLQLARFTSFAKSGVSSSYYGLVNLFIIKSSLSFFLPARNPLINSCLALISCCSSLSLCLNEHFLSVVSVVLLSMSWSRIERTFININSLCIHFFSK